jgi:hypothetical protein
MQGGSTYAGIACLGPACAAGLLLPAAGPVWHSASFTSSSCSLHQLQLLGWPPAAAPPVGPMAGCTPQLAEQVNTAMAAQSQSATWGMTAAVQGMGWAGHMTVYGVVSNQRTRGCRLTLAVLKGMKRHAQHTARRCCACRSLRGAPGAVAA